MASDNLTAREESLNVDSIFRDADKFEHHFQEHLDNLKQMIAKLDEYQKTCETRVAQLSGADNASMRGRDKYITDYITALASLSTERRSLVEDAIKIRQAAVDYAVKNSGGNNEDTSTLLQMFILMQKNKTKYAKMEAAAKAAIAEDKNTTDVTIPAAQDIDKDIADRLAKIK